jgi:hypothetical protein
LKGRLGDVAFMDLYAEGIISKNYYEHKTFFSRRYPDRLVWYIDMILERERYSVTLILLFS